MTSVAWRDGLTGASVATGVAAVAVAALVVTIPAAAQPAALLPVLLTVGGGGALVLLRPGWLPGAWAALTWSALGAHWFGGLPSPVEFGAAGLLLAGLWWRRGDAEQLRRTTLLVALLGLPLLATGLVAPGGAELPHALVHDLPLLAVMAMACRDHADVRRVLTALVALGIALGVGAVWSVQVGPTAIFPLNPSSAVFEFEAPRAAGPFGEANFFALSLVVLLPAALMLALGRRAERPLGIVGALALLAGILATGSRAAFVAAGVAVLGAALLERSRLLLVSSVLAAAVCLPFFAQQLSGASTRTTSGRQSEAQVALAMAADHPVVGVGPGAYPAYYRDYARRVGSDPRSQREPHSLPLEVVAEQGVIGVLGWLAAIAFLAGVIVRSAVMATAEGRTLVLSLVTFASGALFLHGSQLRLLWILVGLTLAVARPVARPTAVAGGVR